MLTVEVSICKLYYDCSVFGLHVLVLPKPSVPEKSQLGKFASNAGIYSRDKWNGYCLISPASVNSYGPGFG